jgi:hypothetical protein
LWEPLNQVRWSLNWMSVVGEIRDCAAPSALAKPPMVMSGMLFSNRSLLLKSCGNWKP